MYQVREVGRFVRALRLPVAVEEAKIEAVYQDGILTVRVPKRATAVGRRILIE